LSAGGAQRQHGVAERMVGLAKTLMTKMALRCQKAGSQNRAILASYTHREHVRQNGFTPLPLLLGRRPLPLMADALSNNPNTARLDEETSTASFMGQLLHDQAASREERCEIMSSRTLARAASMMVTKRTERFPGAIYAGVGGVTARTKQDPACIQEHGVDRWTFPFKKQSHQ